MKKNFFDGKVRIFAHRGRPQEYPENTLISFENAVELGVDVIETDIHFTKDKRFVAIHDDVLERVTNGTGKVSDYSIEELKEFDAGHNFTTDNGKTYPFRGKNITLPCLEEIFEKFPNQRFNIDLKDKNTEQLKYYGDIIKRFNAQDRVLTASEHGANLKGIRELFPEMATSFSFWEALGFYFFYKIGFLFLFKHFDGDALQIPEYFGPFHVVTRAFVQQAHEMGINVHVWTINKKEDIVNLLNLGVDGIITDNPVLFKDILEN